MKHKHTPTDLYTAYKSFVDMVSLSRQTSNVKILQLQAWQVITDLH